jgi:uncharacterized protein YbjT (DUF2867 family)
MKIVLAGAFGNLGTDVLKSLVAAGHEVTAADTAERECGVSGYTFRKIDVTDPATLKGLCGGADIVISTVGLTKASDKVTNFDVDYRGNVNLLGEARDAGVNKFVYISVLRADEAPRVPILKAKYLAEEEIKKSGLDYIIYRPTGYFYDIVKVFRPMVEKGKVTLLSGAPVSANVIDTPDFADYIVSHLADRNLTVPIGGTETYTYEQIAKMCFAAAGRQPVISHVPPLLFDVLALASRLKKDGREAVIRFGKFTMTQPMVAEVKTGSHSFAQYIKDSF